MNIASSAEGANPENRLRRHHAGLAAVRQDARRSAPPGAGYEFTSPLGGLLNVLRFCWTSDDFVGTVLYRLRVSLRDRGVPALPWLIDRFCAAAFRIRIADDVVIGQGLHVLHGNVTIEGSTRIGTNVSIAPWVSVSGDTFQDADTSIGDEVFIGTGSTIRGPVIIGDRAVIGARAVVTDDVAPDTTIVGNGTVSHPSADPSRAKPVPSTSYELPAGSAAVRWSHKDHPPLGLALRTDSVAFATNSNDPRDVSSRGGQWRNVLRLLLQSRSFDAVGLYRLRTAFRALGLPLLPAIVNKLNVTVFNVRIGEAVRIAPGICIPRGNVVIDGIGAIDTGCVIGPSSTIGLQRGLHYGPRIESHVRIGANVAILGDIRIGRGAKIRPGSAVVRDVQNDAIVAGVPARTVPPDAPEPAGTRKTREDFEAEPVD